MQEIELDLGNIAEVLTEYNKIIRARREKVGNTIWCQEWESKLTDREKAIMQAANALKNFTGI